MHRSAMLRMKWFVENYIPKDKEVKVLDVGSYSVNGNYRSLFAGTKAKYVGLDISAGPNVDLVVKDPYRWNEIGDESFDYVISGNAFEHIEYPWLTIEQICNVLNPGGIVCILTPFALGEHRYPTDCYRYYSDGLSALAKWANLKVIECTVGGIPKADASSSDWKNTTENYDDTLLIACKTTDDTDLTKFPRMNHTVLTREWRVK